ncbi:MAG: GTPase [Candidatus Hodarchaeales archaeon]|jgi:small GTP-binding protein
MKEEDNIPTNLPPQANAAWERHQDATTTAEKISTLEEYMSLIPKHKGVQKLMQQCKVKLSKLRAELEKEKQKKKGTGERWILPKEDDAQATILGLPNSGKTALVNYLSGAKYLEAEFEFTTVKPQAGTIDAKGAKLQLVDLPSVVEGSSTGIANGSKVLTSVRNSDLVIITIDLSSKTPPEKQFEIILNELDRTNLKLNLGHPSVLFEKVGSGGRQVYRGDYFVDGGKEAVEEILNEHGYVNAIVRFYGSTSIDELLDCFNKSLARMKCIVFSTKGDLPGSANAFKIFKNYLKNNHGSRFPVIPFSTKKGDIDAVETGEQIFSLLKLIRIYTRTEQGQVSEKPLVLEEGTTVKDVITNVSKKMLKTFRFARVYGKSVKFSGERVGLDHELNDQDQITIYS